MDRHELPVFPGWETKRLIGHGNFGSVYEIERDVFGEREKCALKYVSIPREESEIRNLRIDGMDDSSITESFTYKARTLVSEYNLMIRLNDCPNVVSSYDINVNKKKGTIGWDIYIRMELLTPLTEVLLRTPRVWSEEEILALGKDICSALVSCQKDNILHRDIKPENIFVSKDGIYKLGDFGIARLSDREGSLTMQIGTYAYMAPEVFAGEEYDAAADICSLGIVLYWFLNGRRLPFVKNNSRGEKDSAIARRLSGETVPLPEGGSESFKRVVLKACAANPKDRYRTASEMLEDLKAVKVTSKSADTKKEEPAEIRVSDNNMRQSDDEETVWIGDYISPQPAVNKAEASSAGNEAEARPAANEAEIQPAEKEAEVQEAWYEEADGTVGVWDWMTRPMLISGGKALEEGNWISAGQYFDKVLEQDSENAKAYLGKLMAERRVRRREELADCEEPLDRSVSYKKALQFGGKKYGRMLEEYNARILRRKEIINRPKNPQSVNTSGSKSSSGKTPAAAPAFSGNNREGENLFKREKDSAGIINENEAKRLEANLRAMQERDAAIQQRIENRYTNPAADDIEAAAKNQLYDTAISCMSENTRSGYESAIRTFRRIPGWRDASSRILECEKRIEEIKKESEAKRLEANLRANQERLETYNARRAEEAEKIEPLYLQGRKGMARKTLEGYEEAIKAFKAIPGWKDADALVVLCKNRIDEIKKEERDIDWNSRLYDIAKARMTENTISGYEGAIRTFHRIAGWKDADSLVLECNKKIEELKKESEAKRLEANLKANQERIAAKEAEIANRSEEDVRKDAVYAAGRTEMARRTPEGYKAAIKLFQKIRGWKDTEELIILCRNRIIGIDNPNIPPKTSTPVKTAPASAVSSQKWLCDCGSSNPASASVCPVCGRAKSKVYENRDKKKNVWDNFRDQFT